MKGFWGFELSELHRGPISNIPDGTRRVRYRQKWGKAYGNCNCLNKNN